MNLGKTNGQWLEIMGNISEMIMKQGKQAVGEYAKGLNIRHCGQAVDVLVYENYETGRAGVDFICKKCERRQNIDVRGWIFKTENPVSMEFMRECLEEIKKMKPDTYGKYSEQEQQALVKLAWILFNAYGTYEEADKALETLRQRKNAHTLQEQSEGAQQ